MHLTSNVRFVHLVQVLREIVFSAINIWGVLLEITRDIIQWVLHHVIFLSGYLKFRETTLAPSSGRRSIETFCPSLITRINGAVFTLFPVAVNTILPGEDVEGPNRWHNLRHYKGIFPKELNKAMEDSGNSVSRLRFEQYSSRI